MNYKGSERKESWPQKISLSQDILCLGRDSNRTLPNYKSEISLYEPAYLVTIFITFICFFTNSSALAWLLIPQTWSWTILGGYITYNSWHVFLTMSAIPSFLAGCCICFFDESPKFLMSCGRRDEALRVFQRVYSINTGNPPETYPVRILPKFSNFNKF